MKIILLQKRMHTFSNLRGEIREVMNRMGL